MLGVPEAGVYLAATHYLGALLTGVIFGLFRRRSQEPVVRPKINLRYACSQFREDMMKCPSAGVLMADAVEKAMMLMLRVGGYVILFSVIMQMLSVTGVLGLLTTIYSPLAKLIGVNPGGVSAMILGGLEMTAGCAKVAAAGLPLSIGLPILASVIAFSGLCVHMQTHAICAAVNLKPKGFGLAKMLHGTLSSLLCALALQLFPLTAAASSISGELKNAVLGGVIFASVALLLLLMVRFIQRRRRTHTKKLRLSGTP
jgi:hypothetical protein